MSTTPFWYDAALQVPSETAQVTVAGATIEYATWGEIGNPGIVLIHGSNAHLEWWRFTAPFLADRFRVAALDLSGNGNSDWRERYSGELFAEEVWAVCQAAELGPRPFVVGHSFGGFAALETGHHYGDQLGGVLFMDFTVAPPEDYIEWGLRVEREGVAPGRKLRVYPDKATAMGRFRLIPEQPGVIPELLAHMADYRLKQVEGGWTWKFDDTMFSKFEFGTNMHEDLARLECRVGVIYGEDSYLFSQDIADYMFGVLDESVPFVAIPEAQHHLFLDQPLAFVSALRTLLAEWRHSRPQRGG